MTTAFIAVGSNIHPEDNIRKALLLLSRKAHITGVSTVYRTQPEGAPGQPLFYNAVVKIETDLAPLDLKFSALRPVEEALGRARTGDKSAPRTIDLDILLYDDVMLEAKELMLPDPRIESRAFLAIPLRELAPDLVMPGSEVPIAEIAGRLVNHGMTPLIEYTELLRKDLGNGL